MTENHTSAGRVAPWVAGEFNIIVFGDPEPCHVPVAGWVSGIFGLDFRVFVNFPDDGPDTIVRGWILTHIPTGRACAKLGCGLERAIEISERIMVVGDWDFTDPNKGAALGKSVLEIFATLSENENQRGANVTFGPNWNARTALSKATGEV